MSIRYSSLKTPPPPPPTNSFKLAKLKSFPSFIFCVNSIPKCYTIGLLLTSWLTFIDLNKLFNTILSLLVTASLYSILYLPILHLTQPFHWLLTCYHQCGRLMSQSHFTALISSLLFVSSNLMSFVLSTISLILLHVFLVSSNVNLMPSAVLHWTCF